MDKNIEDLFFSFLKKSGRSINDGMDMPKGWAIQSELIVPSINISSSFGLFSPIGGSKITGHQLLKQIINMYAIGKDINYLFYNQALIPEDWKGKTLLFMGRVLKQLDGSLFVENMYYREPQNIWRRSLYCLNECIGPNSFVPILTNVN